MKKLLKALGAVVLTLLSAVICIAGFIYPGVWICELAVLVLGSLFFVDMPCPKRSAALPCERSEINSEAETVKPRKANLAETAVLCAMLSAMIFTILGIPVLIGMCNAEWRTDRVDTYEVSSYVLHDRSSYATESAESSCWEGRAEVVYDTDVLVPTYVGKAASRDFLWYHEAQETKELHLPLKIAQKEEAQPLSFEKKDVVSVYLLSVEEAEMI